MKTQALLVVAWMSACSALSLAAIPSASNPQPESPEPAIPILDQKPAPTKRAVSAGIADILKMAERGVDSSVIKSFVENYPVAYNPSADEIIALHDAGLSSDVITAALRRNGESGANSGVIAQRSEVRKPVLTTEMPPSSVQMVAPPPAAPASQVTYVEPSYIYPTYPTYAYSYALPLYYSSAYLSHPYHYLYGPRSYRWPVWPSWPSYSVNAGFRSSYHARPAVGFRPSPQRAGHFVRR